MPSSRSVPLLPLGTGACRNLLMLTTNEIEGTAVVLLVTVPHQGLPVTSFDSKGVQPAGAAGRTAGEQEQLNLYWAWACRSSVQVLVQGHIARISSNTPQHQGPAIRTRGTLAMPKCANPLQLPAPQH